MSSFENIPEDYCSERDEAKKAKNKGLEYIDQLQKIRNIFWDNKMYMFDIWIYLYFYVKKLCFHFI